MGKMLPRNIKIGYLLIGLVLCSNSEIVAGSATECYQCAGEDCDDPAVVQCPDANENEQCYISLDANYDFIGMGCSSALGNATQIAELIRNKRIYVCSTSNCNGYENLAQPNDCTECNSTEDARCATKPRLAGRSVRCNNVPYTKCYQRVNLANNGTTERGCLFELEGDDFYNCLTGEDALCSVCEDGDCNVEIIPASRTQCQRCDSLTDSNCSSAPSALSICPTYVANDACVSVYESGVTRRGCSSEFSCDDTARNCQVCSGTGCNQANVQRRSEELYGIFQDLPLNCNTCSGEECLVYSQRLRKCEGDIYQDCVTVFNESSVVVARGCETAVAADYESHCAANPELCFNCKSNGCNNITEVKATQQCVYCDEATNADCLANVTAITTTRACVEGCVTALYERKSNPNVFDLARTCFEDLEFDDRTTCNEANNCVRCTEGDRCNTAAVPADGRLSCLHCDGDDCDEPESLTCSGYSASDQCYIYFDPETHSAVRMGCRSSVSADAIYNDIIHYFLCDGDDCNSYSNLPDAHMCYVCDSSVDANCAINPTAITAQTRCQINPHTDCFTRINEDGHTIRGCISTLNNTQFLSCNEGTPGEFCHICTASDCNRNVFPSSRQRCHRCNSTNDPTCESEPQAQSVCPIFDEDDYCVSKLVDGVVYRGCATEIQCDANSNSRTCRTCEDDNCNDYEFLDDAIGNPGYFQGLPLNCYQCNGTEECSESLGKIRKCENNNLQTCTTVFSSTSGLVIARGCSDAQEEACADDSNSCYGCKSNGCNLATSEADYIDCIFCDAQEDETCLTNVTGIRQTRKCYKSCMTALYNRTDDASPVRELIRTCLDDMDLDDREICAAGNDASCKACSSESCNTDDVGTRISCYQCVDDECQDAQPKTCRAVSENDRCFVQYDETGSIVELGCQSKYDPAEVQQLIVAQRLWVCDGENCNTIDASPTSQACAICSSATDSACAIAPSAVTSVTTCAKLPYTQCYSRLLDSGHTERGCLSSIEGDDFYDCLLGTNSTKCLACVGANCNNEIYPANRLSCHQCNSTATASCDSAPAASGICLKYSASEQCVATLDENDNTIRGCSSQVSCASGTCQTCQDSDCNLSNLKRKTDGNPGIWQPLPLSCKVCDSQSDCAGTTRNLTCSETSDYCMTVFGEQGDVVKRGCSTAVEAELGAYCDANSSQCHNCNSNDCNTATSLADYVDCIYCDSETNANCVSNTEAIATRRQCNQHCMTALRPRSENSDVYELTRSCLDDKDAEDQVVCQTGSDMCVACQGAACNTAKLPVSTPRRSCYICEGEDCIIPDTAECRAFKADDQCFVLFDSESDVKRMGCLSELDDAYVQANIQLLLLCSEGDNCNGFDNFPTPTSCVQCDSEDDETCANDPLSAPTVTRCASLPHVECYTRLLSDGTTRRGCANTLSRTVLVDCLSGNSSSCQTCTSDLCNSEIFPAGRRSCHRCNSKDDDTCESSPAAASVCPLYNADEFCAVKLVNGYIYRGCSSEFQCDVTNTQNCRHCANEDNCNTADLLSANIGYPGKWQDLPLNCYTCDSDECSSNSLGLLRKCENNNQQNCETVFGANGTVVRRGCSDDVASTHEDYCATNSDKCVGCKSNGCNNATSLDQFIDCYYCDSVESSQCALNFVGEGSRKRKCQTNCVVALYPRSSADDPAYELTRTCLDDLELDDREDCLAGNNELCVACTGALCNTAAVPENRHKCYKCTDDECADYAVAECSAYHPNDQCYITFDDENSVLGMGCRSEYEQVVVTELVKQQIMWLCDGEACNGPETIPTAKTCTACDSQTDARCATNPNLVTSTERCTALPYTDCYTRINEDGHTSRGCLSKLTSDAFYSCLTGNDTLCETCSGEKCNALDVFPSDRWQCHQCTSDTDSLCSKAPNSNKVCPIYSANDSCVTNWQNGITTRGCASSLKCDDESDSRTCRVCNSTGCNTIDMETIQEQGSPGRWQDVPLTCRTCQGVEDCTSLGIYRACTGNLYQSCATVFNTNGNVIERGCSDAVEETNSEICDANPEQCLRCNSNGCNNATSLTDYIDCLYCDTESNEDCVTNVAALNKTRKCNKYCMTALYPKFDETNPAYALSRSCLDDMDVDEREACAVGELANCQVCDAEKCNTHAVPTTRLSCNVCKDDDCQDPQPSTCVNYREGDRCYIEFDEQRTVVGMGCRSEYINADADYLLQKKRLFLCEGDNCNTFDAIPASQTCTICSSRTDLECATNPEDVTAATTCAIAPYTHCYSRVLTSGVTERGCLSSLEDEEFVSCLNGTAAHCEACQGSYCNQKLYPDSRLSCYVCDSSLNSSCESQPNSVSVCPLYADNDTCVTAYRDGVTYRGCSSSLQCDSSDSKSCVQCVGDACNIINLERVNDDNYGRWQDLPLTCLSCSGDECNSANVTQLQCENNNVQDCVTVFEDGAVVRRGCSDAVELEHAIHCSTNADDCLYCKSNVCNNATTKSQYNECIYCDSNKNLSCLWDAQSSIHKTRLCQGSCMTALYPSDVGEDSAYELIRTCLDDKEAAERLTCASGSDALCKSCTGSKCNTDIIPTDRRSCYLCEGDDCEEPQVQVCPLYKSDDQCFIWYDETNSVSQMGCLSSFRNQELETIISTKRIYVCDGEACNSLDAVPPPQMCAVCDSNEDFTCATNAQEIGTFNTCSQYPYTSCYTKLISTDGSTTRGCLSDLATTDFVGCVLGTDTNCSICIGEGCNREVFPADRQQCYTCTSEDETACESNPTRLLPCPYVTNTETCRTALVGNVTLRGCSSEVLCDVSDRNCRSCVGTGCNIVDMVKRAEDDGIHGWWQELPLRCHICEGEHCLNSLGPAYTCSGHVEQDCATVFTADGEVKRRGCYEDVEDHEQRYCLENPHLCFSCKSNECNDAWNITDYVQCNFCTSETDPLCVINPENAVFANRSCHKECMVAQKDSQVIRTCLDDKEVNQRYVCRANANGGTECASCDTDNCNNFVFPSDRLRCHVCSDATCSTSTAQYCAEYDQNDFCFAKYENGQPELLGCGSAQNSSDLAAWEAEQKLYRCTGNDCNAIASLPATGGYCLSCNSSLTPACAQNPTTFTITEACPALEDQCVTYLSTGGLTQRGCLSRLSAAEQTSCQAAGTCAICTGDRCNNEIFPSNRRRCHICNSTSDNTCASAPNSIQICPVYAANDRCVTKRTEFIERGCESELTCDTSDEGNCNICEGDGCNTVELYGGALMATASLLTTTIFAIVALVGLRFN